MIKLFFAIIFILYVWSPNIFERYTYFNEILSLYGMFVFWQRKNYFLNNEIIKTLYPFLLLFIIVWFCSLFFYENLFILVRRLSILYSVFCIFAIYDLAHLLQQTKLKWLWFFPIQKVNLLFSYMYLVSTIIKKRFMFWVLTFLFIFFYTMNWGGSTALFSITFTFLMFNLKRFTFKFFMLLTLFVCTSIYFLYFQNITNHHMYDIFDYMDRYYLFSLDGNFTVRLFMWWEVLTEILPFSYGFGVGFGTAIFSKDFIYFLGLSGQLLSDELLIYTLSPHNSFVYFIATMGVPGFISLYYMYFRLFKIYRLRVKNLQISEPEYIAFFCFIAFSIASALNVVIESPIHSGLYWGVLGIYMWSKEQSDKREIK